MLITVKIIWNIIIVDLYFQKLYGITYDKAVQLTLDDYDENGELKDKLESDEKTINLANALGKSVVGLKKGSNKNPVAQAERDKSNYTIKIVCL